MTVSGRARAEKYPEPEGCELKSHLGVLEQGLARGDSSLVELGRAGVVSAMGRGKAGLAGLWEHMGGFYDIAREQMKPLKRYYDRWIKAQLVESRNFLRREKEVGATQAYSEYWVAVNKIFDGNEKMQKESDFRALVHQLQEYIGREVAYGAAPEKSCFYIGGSWSSAVARADSDIDAVVYPADLPERGNPDDGERAILERMHFGLRTNNRATADWWGKMNFLVHQRFILKVSAQAIELILVPEQVHPERPMVGFKTFRLNW